ncbi:MAG: oxalurate catabolism protein HpxZ [Burkholderiaceae bacterium]
MADVNLPEAVAELTEAFHAYERALIGNDIEGLNDLFLDSSLTMRYGVKELLYSHAEIAQFRRERGPVDQRRSLRNTRITTFGRNMGTANTEYVPFGTERVGRQSQTWIRTARGWKIVSAHVSFLA